LFGKEGYENINIKQRIGQETSSSCQDRANNTSLEHLYRFLECPLSKHEGKETVEYLSKSKCVTVWKVNAHEDWRDYFHMLQKAYNILSKCGLKIKVNHIFTAFMEVNDNNDVRFFTRLSDPPEHQRVFGDVRNKNFVPQGGNRLEELRSLQIEKVSYKGLPGYNKS
jgi:hypothetical protein